MSKPDDQDDRPADDQPAVPAATSEPAPSEAATSEPAPPEVGAPEAAPSETAPSEAAPARAVASEVAATLDHLVEAPPGTALGRPGRRIRAGQVLPGPVPAPGRATRRQALLRLRVARSLVAAICLVVMAYAAGFVAGPLSAIEFGPRPGPSQDAEGVASAASPTAARPWPAWAMSSDQATGVSAALPTLAGGYRGWAAAPPAAVVAAPQGEGQPNPISEEVRGIYLTAYTAGQPAAFRNLVELVDSTALNAMVINIKDEEGHATYETSVPAFRDGGAIAVQISDIDELLRVTKAYGIYTIGRLVTFEDSTLPKSHPEWAVHRPDGSIWRDRNGRAWTDPFRTEVWDYNLSLAEEAAQLGFDEIQFDYVRFPTDGETKNAVFSQPSGPDNIYRVRAITEFLNLARERLSPYGCLVSADVFGIILSTKADTSLGQVLEEIYPAVDYLSPMIYPSHYGPGHFGLSSPDAAPYYTVRGALTDALERLGPDASKKLRPWLQDFSLYNHYGPEQVLDQIRATHELGVRGWLLWNPSNVYTMAALRAYTVNQEAYLNPTGP